MDIVNPVQVVTVLVFLGVLGLIWLAVMRGRGLVQPGRIGPVRRLRLTEVLTIGAGDRAMILRVDDRDFLLIGSKNGAPVLTELTDTTLLAPPQRSPAATVEAA